MNEDDPFDLPFEEMPDFFNADIWDAIDANRAFDDQTDDPGPPKMDLDPATSESDHINSFESQVVNSFPTCQSSFCSRRLVEKNSTPESFKNEIEEIFQKKGLKKKIVFKIHERFCKFFVLPNVRNELSRSVKRSKTLYYKSFCCYEKEIIQGILILLRAGHLNDILQKIHGKKLSNKKK